MLTFDCVYLIKSIDVFDFIEIEIRMYLHSKVLKVFNLSLHVYDLTLFLTLVPVFEKKHGVNNLLGNLRIY